MHCWKILCKKLKWSDRLLELNNPSPVMKYVPITQASAEIDNETISRPEGRDSAKKRRSSGADVASSSTAVDMLHQIHERHGKTEEKQEQQMLEILTMKGDKMKLSEKLFELQKQDMEKRSADIEKRSAYMEKRTKLKEEQISLTKKDIEVRAEQSEAQMIASELAIMGVDLDKLVPHVRAYYIAMQHKIMQCRGISAPPPK